MASVDFDPEEMFSALAEGGVRFILIGGMAAVLHGDVGVTVDIDVVPERTDENLERLAEALRRLGARIRTEGEPEGLTFDCSAEFFGNMPPDAIVNMTTDAGDLDVTFCPSGTSGFSDLKRDAIDIVQHDAARAAGITEARKIADMASAFRVQYAPHTGSSSNIINAVLMFTAALWYRQLGRVFARRFCAFGKGL